MKGFGTKGKGGQKIPSQRPPRSVKTGNISTPTGPMKCPK